MIVGYAIPAMSSAKVPYPSIQSLSERSISW